MNLYQMVDERKMIYRLKTLIRHEFLFSSYPFARVSKLEKRMQENEQLISFTEMSYRIRNREFDSDIEIIKYYFL